MSQNKIKLITIVGPTASGKTSLSINIAKDFGGEIISADSMQIYKGMDIATAKPSFNERRGVQHYLMDYVSPSESYSVARFIDDAKLAINNIVSRSKTPIIAGGTGLYIDSLLSGMIFSDGETNLGLRNRLFEKADTFGLDSLLEELKAVDPESAKRLSVERNPKRIVRALEIFYTTGVTQTEQNILSKNHVSEYDPTYIGLSFRDREKLYERINLRVDLMLQQGLLKEAQTYYNMNLSNTSSQAIGYKELKPYIDNQKSLEECVETLKRSTRRYAKRQLTWFRRNDNIKWFYVDDYEDSSELKQSVQRYLICEGFELNEE